MKGNIEITPELLDNKSAFSNEFFRGIAQRTAPAPLELCEGISKDYLFPTFYGDVSCSLAIFHCDYEAARSILPDSRIEPVKMTGGRSLVILSCYEYRNVEGIGPYNEIVMNIPVVTRGSMNIPVVTMLLGDKLKSFGYYVFHMPVTSLENQIRGHKIWGLPKEVEQIDIDTEGGQSVTRAYQDSESPYLELRVPASGGSKQTFDVKSTIYSYLNSDLLKSTTQFSGDFIVSKNMKTLIKSTEKAAIPVLTLGEGEMADKLRSLKIEEQAFQFRYTPSMSACFDLPHGKLD